MRVGGRFFMIADSAQLQAMSEKTVNEILDNYLDPTVDAGTAVIVDRTYPGIFDDAQIAIDEGFCWKADSIEELAEVIGSDSLPETVQRYNQFCENGVDEEMYKNEAFLLPVTEPPFYAVECIANAWATIGGLKTDDDCRVVDENQNAIPGLYAVGMDSDCWAVPYSLVTTTSTFSVAGAYLAARHAAKRAME